MTFLAKLSIGTEKRTQLLYRDDGKLEFRKLPVQDGFLVVKTGDDVKQGWLHYHTNQFSFKGYKNIPADMVTLSSSRDIVLDDFKILKPEDKPTAGAVHLGTSGLVKKRIQEIAETVRHKVQVKPGYSPMMNRITLFLGITLVVMVLSLAIQYALRQA